MKVNFRQAIILVVVLLTSFGPLSVAKAQPSFLTNGLAAYYTFNNNANDASGNLNNGVLNGTGISFVTDRFGFNNAAVHFAGGGFISITPTPFNVTNDYSLCFWEKLDGAANPVNNFFSSGSDVANGMNIRNLPNTVVGWAYIPRDNIGIDAIQPTTYTLWHHFVCTHQGTNYAMYIDGQLAVAGTHIGDSVDAGSLWIGRHENNGDFYDVHGAMDDIRLYSRTLSSNEVSQLFAVETAGLTRTATGTATITNGFDVGVTITDGGFGYTNTPLVRFIGGGGSSAQGFATISNGMVISVTMINPGSNYVTPPLIVIEPPFIPNPFLNAAPMSFLTFSNLIVGSNYQLQFFSSNFWANKSSSFIATNTVLAQFFPGLVGAGAYRLALAPAPLRAFATPEVVNGFVVGGTVTSGGSGYITAPAVAVVGGGGSNAVAFSQIHNGVVTNVGTLSAGMNYTNSPAFSIAPPPAGDGITPTVQPVLRVDGSRLSPYDNYQFQFRPDLNSSWSDYSGSLFTPTNATNSQFLFFTNNGTGFFRMEFVP